MSRHVKATEGAWLVLYAMGACALALSAQGASFDCGKAGTNVERLICGDAELSKLDETLAGTYNDASKDYQVVKLIKYQQLQWIKERNKCADIPCLRKLYLQRIAELNGAESYTLVMSKDTKLCNTMLALFNDDIKAYRKVEYDQHDMFTNIWEPVDLDEAHHPTYGCLKYWRGIFDINNDGKDELVIKRSACLSGALTDSLSY